MNIDEHAIWDLPVPDSAAPAAPAAPAHPRKGRLYRSAGATSHPEAVVALPGAVRPAAPVEAPAAAVPEVPEVQEIAPSPATDALLDRLVRETGAPEQPQPTNAPPADWFQEPVAQEAPAPEPVVEPVVRKAPLALSARGIALALIAVTGGAAVVEALLTGALGILTGVALVAITAVVALKAEQTAAWTSWVFPAYALIAAVLLGGQLTDTAPGASVVGQGLLVATSLITLAPWLAIATALGAVVQRARFR